MSADEMIALVANGNIDAFEQLYNTTYQRVYSFILSMLINEQLNEVTSLRKVA